MTPRKTMTTIALTALLIPALAYAATPAAPASVNTNAEKAAWEALMAPEGEYAALAAYTAVVQRYGQVEPYATILRSEQMHVQALTRQLQRYGVTVPANPYLGKIPAPASLKAAAQDEAQAEVRNVALYDRLFALASGDAMLTRVFTNLRSASQDMHLPLFQKAAAGNGTLSAAELTAFHNTNMNAVGQGNGPGNAQGMNAGQGQGNAQGLQAGRQGTPGQGMGMMQGGGTGMRQGQNMNADCPMHSQNHQNHQNQPGKGRGNGPGWRR